MLRLKEVGNATKGREMLDIHKFDAEITVLKARSSRQIADYNTVEMDIRTTRDKIKITQAREEASRLELIATWYPKLQELLLKQKELRQILSIFSEKYNGNSCSSLAEQNDAIPLELSVLSRNELPPEPMVNINLPGLFTVNNVSYSRVISSLLEEVHKAIKNIRDYPHKQNLKFFSDHIEYEVNFPSDTAMALAPPGTKILVANKLNGSCTVLSSSIQVVNSKTIMKISLSTNIHVPDVCMMLNRLVDQMEEIINSGKAIHQSLTMDFMQLEAHLSTVEKTLEATKSLIYSLEQEIVEDSEQIKMHLLSDITQCDEEGNTLLHRAIIQGNIIAAKFLINNTPKLMEIENNKGEKVEQLIVKLSSSQQIELNTIVTNHKAINASVSADATINFSVDSNNTSDLSHPMSILSIDPPAASAAADSQNDIELIETPTTLVFTAPTFENETIELY